ncbi:hypothetical protein LTR37_002617 [Vermiconidia calcicola]|uniref:Uncharacterized protein n=1 Tax=Vermiconidia calcicola TaxID=1690605 RepID=A0ACC3NS77_9PEZI|nr:hypothetical protein LTR37_002617 [Vermiconidia calcicola]
MDRNTSEDITTDELHTSGLFLDADKLKWITQKLEYLQKGLGTLSESPTYRDYDETWLLEELKTLATTTLGPLCRPASHKSAQLAAKVFNIPELLEEILCHLNAKDILQASITNRSMAAALHSSLSIQKRLCLKVDANSFFHTPFAKGLFRSVWLEQYDQPQWGDRDDLDNLWGKVHSSLILRVYIRNGVIPRIGTRYRSMYLCQPPVTDVTLKPDCCRYNGSVGGSEDFTTRPWRTKITTATGVTLGQLIDEATKLQGVHRLCPNVESNRLNADGAAHVGVECVGALSLRYDDPIRVHRREASAKECEGMEERRAEERRRATFRAYTNAKRKAARKGRAIPTLTEYEASKPALIVDKERLDEDAPWGEDATGDEDSTGNEDSTGDEDSTG